MEAKTFIVFLSLVLRLEMSNVMLGDPDLRHRSREEVIEEMAILRKAEIDGKNTVYCERTKLQKRIISAFGIKAPFRDILGRSRERSGPGYTSCGKIGSKTSRTSLRCSSFR